MSQCFVNYRYENGFIKKFVDRWTFRKNKRIYSLKKVAENFLSLKKNDLSISIGTWESVFSSVKLFFSCLKLITKNMHCF